MPKRLRQLRKPKATANDGGKNSNASNDFSSEEKEHYQKAWVTDGAWITGLAGVFCILVLAYIFGTSRYHLHGAPFLAGNLDEQKIDIVLIAIAIVALVMIIVEIIRLWRFDPKSFIQLDPLVKEKQYLKFFLQTLKHYFLLLLLFAVCALAYRSINEYGYRPNNSYYSPWFRALGYLWWIFVWGGLPYLLLTRAFKYNEQADKKDLALLVEKVIAFLLSRLPFLTHLYRPFDINDKRAALGLAVKFFFAPVMTVFLFDNFTSLQNNFDYIASNLVPNLLAGTYDHNLLGGDLGNICSTTIFTIDVGLAWCGYIISSRWVDNQTVSAEPTWFGWLVCLMSYPPFRVMGGWFLTGPGEKLYLHIPNQELVALFGSLMMFSYFLYMLPTIWFGIRFSNLTHRGIIRKGPFAIVRHPAYAAKNIGWWCVGFPVAIYAGMLHGWGAGMLFIAGLVFQSCIYYARAITEERHLSFDPDYRLYCQHVRYRFIPKLV